MVPLGYSRFDSCLGPKYKPITLIIMKAQVIFENDGTITLLQVVTDGFSMEERKFTSVSRMMDYCKMIGLVPTVADTMAVNF